MLETEWREKLVRAELSLSGQVACNKLLIFVSLVFAGLSLLLAAGIGYLLGRQANREVTPATDLQAWPMQHALQKNDSYQALQNLLCISLCQAGVAATISTASSKAVTDPHILQARNEVAEAEAPAEEPEGSSPAEDTAARLNSVLQDPSETVLQPRLGSRDGLVPVSSDTHFRVELPRQRVPPSMRLMHLLLTTKHSLVIYLLSRELPGVFHVDSSSSPYLKDPCHNADLFRMCAGDANMVSVLLYTESHLIKLVSLCLLCEIA